MRWAPVRKLKESLLFRMTMIAIAVHLGIWLIAVFASSVTAVNVILDAVDDELERQVEFVDYSSELFFEFARSLDLEVDPDLGAASLGISERLGWEGNPMVYWDMNGRLIYHTPNAPAFDPPSNPGFFDETIIRNGEETHWRIYYKPVRNLFWLAVGTDTRESRQAIISIAIEALYPMVLILPLTIVGIYLGISRGLRPIAKVAQELEQRSPTSTEPVDTQSIHRELRPMLNSLNGLLGRLSDALENEHRFTANAAHELKTPLTAIKAEVQMRQRAVSDQPTREMLNSIEERVDRAVYTVQQLLTLARLESGEAQLSLETVDLHPVVEQALADHGHLAVDRALVVNFPENVQWPMTGQRDFLAILVGNLVANAFHYTPRNGRIEIAADVSADGLSFRMCNDSAAMTEQEREHLVDRFYRRPGTSSPGAGLGLSIVQRIVEVHGAEMTISDWHQGQGMSTCILFPA
jgi:signal transduction histidine kinase